MFHETLAHLASSRPFSQQGRPLIEHRIEPERYAVGPAPNPVLEKSHALLVQRIFLV